MDNSETTKFLVSISGQVEYVYSAGGIFDEELSIQYETVWGPDWEVISGLTEATSQMARPGRDAEKVVFNLPIELVFSSTNISGWPQLVFTMKGINYWGLCSVQGYALMLIPTTVGPRRLSIPFFRLKAPTVLGEWVSWFTGRTPELADPKMWAIGKDNYYFNTWRMHKSSSVADEMVTVKMALNGLDVMLKTSQDRVAGNEYVYSGSGGYNFDGDAAKNSVAAAAPPSHSS
ncbi:B9 domain-containing protein 1 [Eumeta japonica]|uniref:B9 domain-containing protein 1 n=1 Tax=Eumeta variegata TaxID=151549 RepID=A0A4C1VQ12_EUMVA|nr:B9 domain-containing protein 1 [Eumeta japonica]